MTPKWEQNNHSLTNNEARMKASRAILFVSKLSAFVFKQALRFRAGERASVMTFFSLSLPLMLGAAWFAVNLSFVASQKSALQAAADAAALAAAKQMTLSGQTAATIQQVATNMALSNLPTTSSLAAPDVVSAVANTSASSVSVTLTRTLAPLLGSNFGVINNVITATSTAKCKSSPICVLILDPTSPSAFNAGSSGGITATGCSIISNSTSSTGLSASGGTVAALKSCSAGGYSGSSFSPMPIVDCPALSDPLASRSPPPNANNGCDYNNFSFSSSLVPLNPGVYCGGISVKHGVATFNPGDYIIRGGALEVNAGGSIQGTDVGIYFTGGAYLLGKPNSGIDLAAPSNPADPMVGLVFWEDPNNMPAGTQATHQIHSDNSQNLHGTVYLPQGILDIGGHAAVGSGAQYTIIVARDLITVQQANIVLNTNYSGSNIPVPNGVGNTGGQISLLQ